MDISESAPTSQNANQGSILREGDIGQITDPEVPLVHAVRLLCSRFLLTGHPMGLVPDRQVGIFISIDYMYFSMSGTHISGQLVMTFYLVIR